MALPFYQKSAVLINSAKQTTNSSKRLGRIVEKSEFAKMLEKAQLTTIDDKLSAVLNRDAGKIAIPHRDMPWFLYRECYRRIPLVYNAVNNTADFALQAGYELEGSKDAVEKIEKWIDKTNFDLILHNILKQMQIYGNSYLDVSNINFPKLLRWPDNMFVVVQNGGNDDGKVLGYRQVILENSAVSSDIEFTTDELIHFKWNDAINPFYGLSEIHPALGPITRYENWQLDLGEILHRYASPIIQWKVGTEDNPGTQADIDNFGSNVENRLPGEDLITSSAIEAVVVGAGTNMIQVDGLVKTVQNEIIAALRVPDIFARGGETSNKATAQVALEAFDRKVRALQESVSLLLEDYLFPKIAGKVKVMWNEISSEGELIRAQRIQLLTGSGVPLKIALKMVGLGVWSNDVPNAAPATEKKPGDKPKPSNDKKEE